MPHELNVANRAGIVEEKKKVLEEFQILLKFPAQSSAQDRMMPFHVGDSQMRRDCITDRLPGASLKQRVLLFK
jgi:di/tripeptidase